MAGTSLRHLRRLNQRLICSNSLPGTVQGRCPGETNSPTREGNPPMVHTRPRTRPRNRTFSKIAAGGSSFLLFFSSAALGIMVLLVSYDVVLRNLFGSAMQGVSEYVSAWLMPATILFALAYAEHKSEHIQVTIIEDALSGGPQKALRVLGQLTAVLVSAVMT